MKKHSLLTATKQQDLLVVFPAQPSTFLGYRLLLFLGVHFQRLAWSWGVKYSSNSIL